MCRPPCPFHPPVVRKYLPGQTQPDGFPLTPVRRGVGMESERKKGKRERKKGRKKKGEGGEEKKENEKKSGTGLFFLFQPESLRRVAVGILNCCPGCPFEWAGL